MADVKLRSLAAAYKESDHASYVHHLNEAIEDSRARNIALTGRYGSGKSSILDRFIDEQRAKQRRVLRISISTLGPGDGNDITNRIQKELVKQLIYRAEPGTVRRSRFARRKQLTWWLAGLEALGFTIVVVGLLWLFGIRAGADLDGSENAVLPTSAFALLVFGAAFAGRWIIGDRFVTQVSTGGTSIEFEKRPDSYLDEYLDEILAYFEATEPDLVVFEDLDRFDDARIFDSLRELNTLVNASSHWSALKDHPIRFVYAIKDSLFEKLGEDQDEKDRTGSDNAPHESPSGAGTTSAVKPDSAAAEIERANRTKFFEIVIPVVAFLTHSNARDHLGDVLSDLKMPESTRISRQLVDIVASHTTDMRLMINITNEFVVYAEKLLWATPHAPGISADNLFALVVYKNFHLSDFEALPHRASALDILETQRRLMVQEGIERLQRQRRDLLRGDAFRSDQAQLAATLGERLTKLITGARISLAGITVGSESFDQASTGHPSFWAKVAEVGELSVSGTTLGGHSIAWPFNRELLEGVFSEGLDPVHWAALDPGTVIRKRAALDSEIARLRGADFSDLAVASRHQTSGQDFGAAVQATLKSELARALVRKGFITRYYAEYSSVFYGKYLGVDVANFFRNCVWPNEMQEHFVFENEERIGNLLEQAPSGFTSSRSALNIQIVDYMFVHRPELAKEIVGFLITESGTDSVKFLDAYLNAEGARGDDLVAGLATFPWPGLIDHLAREQSTPDDDSRARLLDIALLSARDAGDFDMTDSARELLARHHAHLPAFTQEQTQRKRDVLMSFVSRSELVLPSLKALSEGMRKEVVAAKQYELTASNLRAALKLDEREPITLDRIRQNANVWRHAADDPLTYFDVIDHDHDTTSSTQSSDVLGEVIIEQHEAWSPEELERLLKSSAPEASVPDISSLPEAIWREVAAAHRIAPNPKNLYTYIATVGLDDALAGVLADGERGVVSMVEVENASPPVIHELAVAILGASERLSPSQRVALAVQLNKVHGPLEIEPTEITPTADDFLAQLLQADLVPDTPQTFDHFFSAGWESIADALKVSKSAHTFITPAVVGPHAEGLLNDDDVPVALKARILGELEVFATGGGSSLLRAAATAAHDLEIALTLDQIELVAPHVSDDQYVMSQLANLQEEFEGIRVMRILALLGDRYSGFDHGSGHSFEIPKSDSAVTVLGRLKSAGFIDLPAGGRHDMRRVVIA